MSSAAGTFWQRAIAHVDLDQFYAAVEILDFPELKGLPLIVGGKPGARGVVSTASYEARKFGVHSAMPSSQAARLCPQGVWRTPRMSRYVEKSREVRRVFERYTDQIEPLSLDEAFLDLTGSQQLFGSPEQIARQLKRALRDETGLVGSVGIAENKFLAKIASDLRKPDGLVVVPPGNQQARDFLAPLPVSRLWGVGPKSRERLHELGLRTIGDLARAERDWLARRIGEHAADHLLALSHGLDNRPVETRERPKSISKENTFAENLHDFADMERELLAMADDVAQRLREEGLKCLGARLKARLGDFTTYSRMTTFSEATDLAEPLYAAACEMLRHKVDRRGQGIRLLGLGAIRLVAPEDVTPLLFADESAAKRRRAAKTVDELRERFGEQAIVRGRLLEGRAENTGTPSDNLI